MTKNTIAVTLIWATLAVVLYLLTDAFLNPNKASTLAHGNTVTLQRDPSGHYRAEAYINEQKVEVLVDTGATGVAIPKGFADTLGINSHAAIRTTTANGETVAYSIRLKSIKLGGIEAKDVNAMITPNLGDEVLLGMSFLNRMDVRLYKGTMTIKQVEE